MPSPRTNHPGAAMAWLLPDAGAQVLDLCTGTGAFTADLVRCGHRVFGITADARVAQQVAARATGATVIRASADRLPFRPRWFDVVTIAGQRARSAEAFPEAVRVLRPGGHLGVLRTTRDDTVPWVRRLAKLLQSYDPTAMTTATSGPSQEEVLSGGWFIASETKAFRHWVPIDRPGLLAMVEGRPRIRQLPEADRQDLIAKVTGLFDDIARGHEVMLPYRVECRKAWPDPERQAIEPSITVGIHMRW
ncbi:class I SAM-dependent methyltransferase [Raineyella fluvialis]|uniref:Methyltransferase domain-containing protein n=1 Tax=Raineyella fluvialis TaxID=2662261 RepID=A0A5Q2FDN0_9ACTN|nr:methyltransferase domain-containing protein [Raineyella fluvialis]QGF22835.1 methyltransferase domain-containing protein [Raineyella fluvialis]